MKTVSLKEIYDVFGEEKLDQTKVSDLAMKVAAIGNKNVSRQENCSLLRNALESAFDMNGVNVRFVEHKIEELRDLYAQKPQAKDGIAVWQRKVNDLEQYGVAVEFFFCLVKKYRR